ncbi:MAG: YxlC family protein [Gorillibacterium sp.]|nr:YxlC family protein [Gorillibacterium sp.]
MNEAIPCDICEDLTKGEPRNDTDEELTALLFQELSLLDHNTTVLKPSLFPLEAMLREHKHSVTRKLKRDLVLFLLAAMSILSLSVALLVRLPLLFFAVQALSVMFPMIFLFGSLSKRRDRRWTK